MNRFLFLVCAAGCAAIPRTAIVDGREVQRPTLQFGGQPYTLVHQGAHPKPGSPSSGLRDAGGRIRGRICGITADYDVKHSGDRVVVDGVVYDDKLGSKIEVREESRGLHFSGTLGSNIIDLQLDRGRLTGSVGRRVYSLERVEDRLEGWLRVPGMVWGPSIPVMVQSDRKILVPVRVRGVAALWEMPAAVQAVVLPNLLTCINLADNQLHPIDVGFGGTPADVTGDEAHHLFLP
jgi:hypothetical protein